MNTITALPNAGSYGIYRHEETGFIIHDVWSVADLVSANGAIAMDMNSGSWSWVAGEDLFTEVYKRGGTTLNNVARNLLSQVWELCYTRLCFGVQWKGTTANDDLTGSFRMTGKLPKVRSVGADVRLFAVHTNLQAGRGMSSDLLAGTIVGADDGSTNTYGTLGYIMSDVPMMQGRNVYYYQNTLKDQHVISPPVASQRIGYGKSANVIGRAVVALPLHSWNAFLTSWRAAVPNINEAEMAERADAAIAGFSSVFKDSVFSVPSIRVPIILTSDGGAYIDTNSTRSITRHAAGTYGFEQMYNPLLSPTIVDENGLWVTNPHCPAPGVAHNLFPVLHEGANCSLNSAPVLSGVSATAFTAGMSKLNQVDGVDLFKIAGGFYPRVDTVKSNRSASQLINTLYSGAHGDQSMPTQGGSELAGDYNTRMSELKESSDYGGLAINYGNWHLCGQVTLTVTTILDALVVGKTLRGSAMFACSSGNLCRLMRVADHVNIRGALTQDVSANPALHLLHQFGG